jgi:single-strand DNA-binding protein
VEGSLRTQQWDKNGEKRYRTEVVVRELQMLDRADENGTPRQSSQSSTPPTAANVDGLDEDFDDIPFF